MRRVSRGQARQFARALHALAEEQGGDLARRLRDELRGLVAILEGTPELRAAVQHPRVTAEARRRVLEAIATEGGASELTRNAVGLLAARDLLPQLPVLADVYGAMVNAAEGVVPAEATGAVALTAEQDRALAAALEAVAGGAVELTTRVEPSVLGGLRVQMGGKTYDGTVRGRLTALRRSLASGS